MLADFPKKKFINYMRAVILNEIDVNSSVVAFIMDWHPFFCL
jgi:hypothetical protein